MFRLIKGPGLLYIVVGSLFHKTLELGGQWTRWLGFSISGRYRSRRDHAGLMCSLQLGHLLLELNLCDVRHWHSGEGRFYRPGEEHPNFPKLITDNT